VKKFNVDVCPYPENPSSNICLSVALCEKHSDEVKAEPPHGNAFNEIDETGNETTQ
jgi:hypothetical protein